MNITGWLRLVTLLSVHLDGTYDVPARAQVAGLVHSTRYASLLLPALRFSCLLSGVCSWVSVNMCKLSAPQILKRSLPASEMQSCMVA